MVKNAVVYGAGQTGRGYTARYLKERNYSISFIEKNKELVNLLNEDKRFCIHFYDKDRTPVLVDNFKAYHISDDLNSIISNADIILTAVGEQNLDEVGKSIVNNIGNKSIPQLLTCENGINPAKVLKTALLKNSTLHEKNLNISQTAIFCSTVNVIQTRLDILSQNETYFPYDVEGFRGELDFYGAEPNKNFEQFLKRKIYTYNCLAGIISYMGYIKGYKIYSEAANDIEISKVIEIFLESLNPSLSNYFGIELNKQAAFAQKAVNKFKDKNILDYVIKNGRAAKRKLGKTERIFAPYEIIKSNNKDARILTFNAAAALTYWYELQGKGEEPLLNNDPIDELVSILQLYPNDDFIKAVKFYYEKIKENRKKINLLELIFNN